MNETVLTFNGFSGANLSLDGMAAVTPNGLLMLTNGTTALKGHAFYPTPLRFRGASNHAVTSFSTAFVFGIIGQYPDVSSQGMAFVVSASRNFSTALPGHFLGLVNASDNGDASDHLFAVELDTVLNAEFRDIDDNHVGVDVNSLTSVRAASAGYYDDDTGSFRNLSLISRKAMQVWVEYDGQAMELNVTMAPVEMSKPKKPLLSTVVNLSAVITDLAFVGFSSSTGIIFSNHYVLGWSFKMNGTAPALNISSLPALPRTTSKTRPKVLVVVLPFASVAFVLALGAAAVVVAKRRAKFAELREDWEAGFGPHRFTYKDLFYATDGFKDKNLLGRGGFGSVYMGLLPKSKMKVAVKRVSHESRQGMKEFIAEVVSLGRLRHRNVVQLLGYCRRKGELLLVYDHMPNGSLDKYLHDQDKPTLDWGQRFKIIKGVASGLLYLHEDWEKVVIHRDIKASNVLLDTEMNGRLGDFGLARLYDHGTDPNTTHVVGTMGYLAPELGHRAKATPSTDVFAFGVFLLEVTCGRQPVEEDAHGSPTVLVDWVLDLWRNGLIMEAADPKLGNDYADEVELVLKLGLLCSHPLASARPSMRRVVQCLDGDMAFPEHQATHMNFSTTTLVKDQGHGQDAVECMVNVRSIPFLLFVLLHKIKLVSSASDGRFAFEGFTTANLILDGAAMVTPSGLLALTNDKHTKGHAFFQAPLRFHVPSNGTPLASFSVTFVFAIMSEHAQLSDHGLAFVVTPSSNLSAATGAQYLGLLNISDNGKASNHILAIELDTVLSPEFHDIDSNHVGIDVNNLQSVKSHTAGYYEEGIGKFLNLTLMSRKAMQVWVDYNGKAMELNVTLAPLDVEKPTEPLLSTAINLSEIVTGTAYVGFSSATGLSIAYHYVLGWSFSFNGAAPILNSSNLPALPRLPHQKRSLTEILVIVLPLATAGFIVALLAVVFMFVRRWLRYAELHEDWEVEFGPQRFSYKDLFHATEGFVSKQLLGIGGFGRVYKGILPESNLQIAVKRVSHDSKQGMKEFIAEIVSMGRLRHKNLVQLLGYCRRKGELLLVYDYMSNGSLDKHLYDRGRPVLSWNIRFHLIKGIASGLLYLHEDWEQVVVHRDIKASNVLLDSEMNGCLGDFGLAKLYDHGTNPRTTHVVGTMGYLSPELLRIGKASPGTDVFAFGIFLLEVTCGRRPLEHDQVVLLDWVLEHWNRGAILETVDPRLCGEYIAEEAGLVLKLGLLCSQPMPNARPNMRQVLQYLDGTVAVPEMTMTNLDYSSLMFVHNEGFDSYTMLDASSFATSIGPGSVLSGGR
ncbi:L-type lectin-domain containing receptor kinase IV.2 [Dichanthelium oligosanthes]|uniref:non-specific serine/threonine protein kinase n=1 Tax=Dichanthelium oligosanthes TaxID=888268 RepID=A0A1E5WHA8_9POAL|nr:L-type lectin-domain containing receptor kinase IV.2 [Dichanthelium oligosanthes]